MKELKRVMRFRGKAKSRKIVARADRRLRTIAGRLCRELDRLLDADSPWRKRLDISLQFINGERRDGHKIYSLHEPDVICIAKGKDRVKYEFGNKVSIVRTWNGLIIGAKSRHILPKHGVCLRPSVSYRCCPQPTNLHRALFKARLII